MANEEDSRARDSQSTEEDRAGQSARRAATTHETGLGQDATPARYGSGDLIAGKYRLGKRLGEGGMGEVWLAHNETLDINVAIKLIRTGENTAGDHADRLLHEARAAARLGHAAIVRINDFGKTSTGAPFIVMELLEGEDLGSALANRGRLSATKAVRTILPIAHALTAAHTKGIVHRDLKPENIFLAQAGEDQLQPKLVDFGVAKLEVASYPVRLTQSGALLGSPLYMSPEQARGDDVDHRADIWALGVVLYEVITGRPPFEGKNYNAVLYSIIANPATPITDLGVADEELWGILDRALQKDPDRRWYSMRDFGEALARWLGDRGIVDDITGASLQTAWFHWKKEDLDSPERSPVGQHARSAAPATEPGEGRPSEAESSLHVTPPPAPPQSLKVTDPHSRSRRKSRVFAYIGSAVALSATTWALWPSEPAVGSSVTAQPLPAPPHEHANIATQTATSRPAFSASRNQAEPPLAPSSLPVADAETPSRSAGRASSPVRSTTRSTTSSKSSKPTKARELKDPFR